jgi:acid-sensing ion channel 2
MSYKGRPNSPYPAFEELMIQYGNYYYAYTIYLNIIGRKRGHQENGIDYFVSSKERMLLSRMSVAANLNETAALEGGTDIEQLIAICDFAGHECTTANFTEFLDPTYFKCFKFDLSGFLDTNKVVFEGKDHGLSLIIFIPGIKIMNYTDRASANLAINQELLMSGEGLRIVIHKPNTRPFPLTDGLDVPRGTSASMGIRLTEHQRLGPPYGNCTTQLELEGMWQYTYTLATCKRMCLQKMIIHICGCADTTLPFPNRTKYPDVQLCARFDDLPNYCLGSQNIITFFDQCQAIFEKWFERVTCMRDARVNISINVSALQKCKCKARCEDEEYHYSYSLSDWPLPEHSMDLVHQLLYVQPFLDKFPPDKAQRYFGHLLPSNSTSPTFDDFEQFVKDKNFVRLNFYISETSVFRVIETEAYSLTQLGSDVGGQLSLWIGVSMITLVELTELILCIVRHCMKSKKESSQDNPEKTDPNKNNEPDYTKTSRWI